MNTVNVTLNCHNDNGAKRAIVTFTPQGDAGFCAWHRVRVTQFLLRDDELLITNGFKGQEPLLKTRWLRYGDDMVFRFDALKHTEDRFPLYRRHGLDCRDMIYTQWESGTDTYHNSLDDFVEIAHLNGPGNPFTTDQLEECAKLQKKMLDGAYYTISVETGLGFGSDDVEFNIITSEQMLPLESLMRKSKKAMVNFFDTSALTKNYAVISTHAFSQVSDHFDGDGLSECLIWGQYVWGPDADDWKKSFVSPCTYYDVYRAAGKFLGFAVYEDENVEFHRYGAKCHCKYCKLGYKLSTLEDVYITTAKLAIQENKMGDLDTYTTPDGVYDSERDSIALEFITMNMRVATLKGRMTEAIGGIEGLETYFKNLEKTNPTKMAEFDHYAMIFARLQL